MNRTFNEVLWATQKLVKSFYKYFIIGVNAHLPTKVTESEHIRLTLEMISSENPSLCREREELPVTYKTAALHLFINSTTSMVIALTLLIWELISIKTVNI